MFYAKYLFCAGDDAGFCLDWFGGGGNHNDIEVK